MIEKGKIPVAIISFDLNPTKPGKTYQYRSPFYDLVKGDIVVVNNKNGLALARVVDLAWFLPGPTIAENNCIISYFNPEILLKDSLRLQTEIHTIATRQREYARQRKEEIEITIQELQKEILKLVKELDTL